MFGYNNNIVQQDMDELSKRNIPYEELKGKNVLVTGASGMLATYVIYTLMHLNIQKKYNIGVVALVRNETKARERFENFLSYENFEITVQDVCEEICLNKRIDYIIHAAGNASPKFILDDPVGIIKANTIGTINILELAKKCGAKRVLYTSTREIYGKVDDAEEIFENNVGKLDPTELRACYPESKRMAETLLKSYNVQYGVDYVTIRIAHSYGPGMIIDNDGRVMADFMSDVIHNRDIVLKSSGDVVRAFCYITDAVAAMFYVLLKGKTTEAYNVANETEPYQIREVAEKLVELFKEKRLKVVFDIPKNMSQGYSKMGRVMLNTEKLENLGWKSQVRLEEGMKRTVESFE